MGGAIPETMAACRNLAIALLRRGGRDHHRRPPADLCCPPRRRRPAHLHRRGQVVKKPCGRSVILQF